MAWPAEKTLEFVEELQLEEVIWNPKHEGHKDRHVVYDSWTRLQNKFATPVKELKKKKDGLFATYRKYARKVAQSKKSGNGTDDNYTPTWSLYEPIDRFLNSVYVPGKTINSTEIEKESDGDETVLVPTRNKVESPTSSAIQDQNDAVGANETLNANNETPSTPVAIKKGKGKKRKLTQTEHVQNQMDEALKILKTNIAPEKTNSSPEKEQLQLFTELLLAKLRGMDRNTQEQAMHEIDNLMFRLRNSLVRRPIQVGVMQETIEEPTSGRTSASICSQQSQPSLYSHQPSPYSLQSHPSPLSQQSEPSPYSVQSHCSPQWQPYCPQQFPQSQDPQYNESAQSSSANDTNTNTNVPFIANI